MNLISIVGEILIKSKDKLSYINSIFGVGIFIMLSLDVNNLALGLLLIIWGVISIISLEKK